MNDFIDVFVLTRTVITANGTRTVVVLGFYESAADAQESKNEHEASLGPPPGDEVIYDISLHLPDRALMKRLAKRATPQSQC